MKAVKKQAEIILRDICKISPETKTCKATPIKWAQAITAIEQILERHNQEIIGNMSKLAVCPQCGSKNIMNFCICNNCHIESKI